MKKRKRRLWRYLAGLLLCLILPGLDVRLKTVHYEVPARGVVQPVRIALVTDLHSCAYGQGQRTLLEAVYAQEPDLILLVGDIFDDDLPDGNTEAFLRGVSDRFPCYYVTGNHEYWSGKAAFARKMDILRACGVVRLSGESVRLEFGDTVLWLCGVDDPYAWDEESRQTEYARQVEAVSPSEEETACTILLAHRPEAFGLYCRCGFDLILSGHTHGGQWRIPGLLNGLFAPDQGLLPEWAGGVYRQGGSVMIVSRGLARESTRLPRFYNRPELVIIDLTSVPA